MNAEGPLGRAALLGFLLLVVPAPAQDTLAERVDAALQRTRPVLLAAVDRAQHDHVGLLCLAAIHDEVPPDHPVLARALRKLAKQSLSGTYQLAVRLMVLADLPTFPDRRALAERDRTDLPRNQVTGGFGYDGGGAPHGAFARFDMSNSESVPGSRASGHFD